VPGVKVWGAVAFLDTGVEVVVADGDAEVPAEIAGVLRSAATDARVEGVEAAVLL
jgi:hypothetical protein